MAGTNIQPEQPKQQVNLPEDQEAKAKFEREVAGAEASKQETDLINAYNSTVTDLNKKLKDLVRKEMSSGIPQAFDTAEKQINELIRGELGHIFARKDISASEKIRKMNDFKEYVNGFLYSTGKEEFFAERGKTTDLEKLIRFRNNLRESLNFAQDDKNLLRRLCVETKNETLPEDTWKELLNLLDKNILTEKYPKNPMKDIVLEAGKEGGAVDPNKETFLSRDHKIEVLSMSLSLMTPRQRYEFAIRVLNSDKKDILPEVLDMMLSAGFLQPFQAKEIIKLAKEKGIKDPKNHLEYVSKNIETNNYEKRQEEIRQKFSKEIEKLKTLPYTNEAQEFLSLPGLAKTIGVVYSGLTILANFFAAKPSIKNFHSFIEDFLNGRTALAFGIGAGCAESLMSKYGFGTGGFGKKLYEWDHRQENWNEFVSHKENQFAEIYFNHPKLAEYFTNNYDRILKVMDEKKKRITDLPLSDPKRKAETEAGFVKLKYEDLGIDQTEKFDSMSKGQSEEYLTVMYHLASSEQILKIKNETALKDRVARLQEKLTPKFTLT